MAWRGCWTWGAGCSPTAGARCSCSPAGWCCRSSAGRAPPCWCVGRPMPLNILECQVPKMVNSDTCPRPTIGGLELAAALHRGGPRLALHPLRPPLRRVQPRPTLPFRQKMAAVTATLLCGSLSNGSQRQSMACRMTATSLCNYLSQWQRRMTAPALGQARTAGSSSSSSSPRPPPAGWPRARPPGTSCGCTAPRPWSSPASGPRWAAGPGSHRRVAPLPIHSTPDSLTYPVPPYLKRQCDGTLGRRGRGAAGAEQHQGAADRGGGGRRH